MWDRSFNHKMPIGTKSANLRAGGKEYGRRMLMEQERRVTRRNGFSVPLPPDVRRIIAPFAAFSEFLPIDPRQWMERATVSYSESCSVGVKIPHQGFVVQEYIVVSRIEKFLKKPIQSMTSLVLVIPNRYYLSKEYSSLSLALLTEWQ